jgi:uncharacterized protein YkwD
MKRLLIYILTLCFISVLRLSSQTKEESMLFDKINQYRDSLGLNKLVWDSYIYKMASYHSKYLVLINTEPENKNLITHDEKFDMKDFAELSFNERCKKFIPAAKLIRENCAGNNMPSGFGGKGFGVQELVFRSWVKSKQGHKENMENKFLTKGACSIVHCKLSIVLNTGKKVQIDYIFVVLDMCYF